MFNPIVRSTLDKAIVALTRAISGDAKVEQSFQTVLEQNPCILRELGMVRVIPHPQLVNSQGETFVPDFVCQDDRGLWNIVEIKPAAARTGVRSKGKRRRRPYAEVQEWIAQGEDYSRWLSQPPAKQQFETTYNAQLHDNLRITLIAGRGSRETNQHLYQATSQRVPATSIYTYDDLLGVLAATRTERYGSFEDSNGLTLLATIGVVAPQRRSTILDVGETTSANRITISICRDFSLTAQVTFSNGSTRAFLVEQSQHHLDFQNPFTFVAEISSDNDFTRIWLGVNREELFFASFRRNELVVSTPPAFVLGADMNGDYSTECISLMTSLVPKPMDPISLDTILEYAASLVDEPDGHCLHFSQGACLYTEGHPTMDSERTPRTTNLVQRNPTKRPILRSLSRVPDLLLQRAT